MYGRKYWGSTRSTFVIDGDGVVQHVIAKAKPATHDDEVLKALAGMREGRGLGVDLVAAADVTCGPRRPRRPRRRRRSRRRARCRACRRAGSRPGRRRRGSGRRGRAGRCRTRAGSAAARACPRRARARRGRRAARRRPRRGRSSVDDLAQAGEAGPGADVGDAWPGRRPRGSGGRCRRPCARFAGGLAQRQARQAARAPVAARRGLHERQRQRRRMPSAPSRRPGSAARGRSSSSPRRRGAVRKQRARRGDDGVDGPRRRAACAHCLRKWPRLARPASARERVVVARGDEVQRRAHQAARGRRGRRRPSRSARAGSKPRSRDHSADVRVAGDLRLQPDEVLESASTGPGRRSSRPCRASSDRFSARRLGMRGGR